MQGKVVGVEEDDFSVEFPLSPISYDRKVNRWSTDLAPFESKTKDDYEWRTNVLAKTEQLECEIHDKSTWNKGHILGFNFV